MWTHWKLRQITLRASVSVLHLRGTSSRPEIGRIPQSKLCIDAVRKIVLAMLFMSRELCSRSWSQTEYKFIFTLCYSRTSSLETISPNLEFPRPKLWLKNDNLRPRSSPSDRFNEGKWCKIKWGQIFPIHCVEDVLLEAWIKVFVSELVINLSTCHMYIGLINFF